MRISCWVRCQARRWRETALRWCDIFGAVYSVVRPHMGRLSLFCRPTPPLMFLASFRGPLVTRVFCAQGWDTSTRCHSPCVHISRPQVCLFSRSCRYVGCKLVCRQPHRSRTCAHSLRWQPVPVPRWGQGVFCVLGQFLVHGEKDEHALLGGGGGVNGAFRTVRYPCLSPVVFIQNVLCFCIKSKEGSTSIFQINVRLA